MTQTDRLIAYLRSHPGASSLEVTMACGIVTGRVSDARALGIDVVCERRQDGRQGYRIVVPVLTGETVGMGL
ncbi:MAG: hypothetical protein H0V50_02850 [Thermoleophilaceae bacterium]|nr:hypothetical protein [Thermoleophilaceae bacterium]